MGIVNCTPDSFSDGGAFTSESAIARRMDQVAEEGADIVDLTFLPPAGEDPEE